MLRRVAAGCRAFALVVLSGCSGAAADSRLTPPVGTETPITPAPIQSVTIVGLGFLDVGATAQFTVAVPNASVGQAPPPGLAWKSSAPEVATIDAAGLVRAVAIGTTTITATVQAASASMALRVGLDSPNPAVALKLGDTLVDVMTAGFGANKFSLVLAAGDTFDLAVAAIPRAPATPLDAVQIQSLTSGLKLAPSLLASMGRIYAAQVAPSSGTYEFIATSSAGCGSHGCNNAGPYVIRTRRSGPVLNFVSHASFSNIRVPQGGVVAPETTWVQNVGTGRTTLTMQSTAPWLSVTPSVATIPGGSSPFASFDVSPKGSVAFVAQIDASRLDRGIHAGDLAIGAPQSVWQGALPQSYAVYIRIDDSTMRVVARSSPIDALVTGPANELFGWNFMGISKIDRETGAATIWQTMPNAQVLDVDWTPDGTAYVSTRQLDGDAIVKIAPNGTRSTLMTFSGQEIRGTAVLPDGRVFTLDGSALKRRGIDGTWTTIAMTAVISRNLTNLVFNPVDGGLYYSADRILHRVDPSTGADEVRGGKQEGDLDLPITAVDRFGRLYARTSTYIETYVLVLDTAGRLVDRIYCPSGADGLAVVGDMLYGVGAIEGIMWRNPVR